MCNEEDPNQILPAELPHVIAPAVARATSVGAVKLLTLLS